jgi:16S rRNA (adenine1518-N6/adenine1519-N6)-dimethyltransferase
MVDFSTSESMANYASLNQNDTVLDIGAGLGFLTSFLADKCGTVLAVESDERLVAVLREQLGKLSNVKIIHGDVLKVHIPQFNKVVSIPPYSISSSLLLWLFGKNFDCAVLLFQKEFADRLTSFVGDENYGWLAVIAYYYAEIGVLDDVLRWMFYPEPEVDSVIVRLKPKKPPPFVLKNKTLFKQLTQSLFTHRNRKVRNAVALFIKGAHIADSENVTEVVESLSFCDKRVMELSPEDFGVLANVFVQ